MLALAILGCGSIIRYHVDAIKKSDQVKVVAVVDPIEAARAQCARSTGAMAFASWEDALEQTSFDAVLVALPHDLHEEFAIRVLRAGKHLLLEKPIAPNLDACARILAEAALHPELVFMVSENSQYWHEVVLAKSLVDSGEIGRLVTARAFYHDRVPEHTDFGWRASVRRSGGGIAVDGGLHWIRPLRMWFGDIQRVAACSERIIEQVEGETISNALFVFKDGRSATFHAWVTQAPNAPALWFHLLGTQGEISIEAGFMGGLVLYNRKHPEGFRPAPAQGYFSSIQGVHTDFYAAILLGTKPAAGPSESLQDFCTALAVRESAAHGGAWTVVKPPPASKL